MEKIILVVHVLMALGVIGLILLQQGKGAEAGASFGAGASQTVFGGQGSGNFFSRTTAVLAAVFFATSFGLAVLAKQQAGMNAAEGMPSVDDAAGIPVAVEIGSDVPVGDVPMVEAEDIPAADAPAVPDVPQ